MPDNSPVQAPPPVEYEVVALKQQPQIDPVTGAVLHNPAQEPAPVPEPIQPPQPEQPPQQ